MATREDRKGLQRHKPLERRTPLKAHSELKRGAGPKRKTPFKSRFKSRGFTPASHEQKDKVAREGARIEDVLIVCGLSLDIVDPAHIVSRARGSCDHEDCIVPLPRRLHTLYDRGELDILPYLTLEEQAHAVSHLGILDALKRTTGDNYVPESEAA